MKLFQNGLVITNDPQNPLIPQGAVAVEGSTILAVGTAQELKSRYPQAEQIDARGGLIMPGMLNSHMHFYSAFARGMALAGFAPKNFVDILEGLWWRLDKVLTPEDNYYSTLVSGIEAIKNGTTTLIDHHASPFSASHSLDELARAATDLGLRVSLSYEVSDRDGEEAALAGIEENRRFAAWVKHEKPELISASFGLHASFTLSDETLNRCAEAADGQGFHVHTAEAISDREYNLKNFGLPVVKRLDRFGIWQPNSIAVHCVHIDEEEMEILKARDVNVVHNPESNMGNAVGRADVLTMLHKGLRVGLGTDGYTTDMFEGIKVANMLHKHGTQNPAAAWGEVPQMSFENNTEIILRLTGKRVGRLQPGWQADIITLDYYPYTPLTAANWTGHILFGVSGAMTRTTMVAGKLLMKDRELLTVDQERICQKALELSQNLWQRV